MYVQILVFLWGVKCTPIQEEASRRDEGGQAEKEELTCEKNLLKPVFRELWLPTLGPIQISL